MSLPLSNTEDPIHESPRPSSGPYYRWASIVMSLASVASLVIVVSLQTAPHYFDGRGRNSHESSSYRTQVAASRKIDQTNRSVLARETLTVILNRSEQISSNSSSNSQVTLFVPPCDISDDVFESTSSLLVATAIAKADNSTLRSHSNNDEDNNMRNHYFNALFAVPSVAGFIPKYLYPVHRHDAAVQQQKQPERYIPNTRIPNWSMMYRLRNADDDDKKNETTTPLPCAEGDKNQPFCWIGSGRISTTPFHATSLLELVSRLERQDSISRKDLGALYEYWKNIFAYHDYLHEDVMRGCGQRNHTKSHAPCYNIVHPWESMVTIQPSPYWKEVLGPTIGRMTSRNWSVPFDIPEQVENSYQYDPDIYAATIFLAECISNQTYNASIGENYPYTFEQDAAVYEDQILKQCQFAMLDVGFASALAQADEDLRKVAHWLRQRNVGNSIEGHSSPGWSARMEKFAEWKEQTRHVMHDLWNKKQQSYMSRYAVPKIDPSYPVMFPVRTPVANNLMVFWQQLSDDDSDGLKTHWDDGADDHMRQMTQQLLHHNGKFSFDCSGFPLWSGGCGDPNSTVNSALDYFVGLGLMRNQGSVAAFGDYLTNATIDMILRNASTPVVAANVSFLEAYPAAASTASSSHHRLALDQCGSTSTATAAIFYHLLVNDFDYSFELPIPPIRNSWILTLISAELIIAFAVGFSCVWLSLSLIRQENSRHPEEEEEENGGGSYVPVEEAENEEEIVESMPGLEDQQE